MEGRGLRGSAGPLPVDDVGAVDGRSERVRPPTAPLENALSDERVFHIVNAAIIIGFHQGTDD